MSGTYRVEVSSTARAGCTTAHCKKEGLKIQKGEIRQGVLVEFNGNQSWKWRHWGCVTPSVIHNWKEKSEGDMDLVDGYDELPAEFQEKIKRAFEQGHVDDEDWNGDMECNRYDPKQKNQGMFLKGAARKKKQEDAEGDDGSSEPKPTKKRSRKQTEDDGDAEAPPAAKKSRAKKAVKDEDGADEQTPATKTKAKPKKARSEAESEPAKKPRGRKVKAEHIDDEAEPEETEEDPKPAVAKKPRATKKKTSAKRDEGSVEPEEDEEEAPAKPQPKTKGRKKKAAAE